MTKLNKQASALKSLLLSFFKLLPVGIVTDKLLGLYSDTQPKGGGFLFFPVGIPLGGGVDSNSCLDKMTVDAETDEHKVFV